MSNYNALQTKLEKQYDNGLQFLATYTWSKTLGDANDLLNGGGLQGFRAPQVPGYGPQFDYGPASYDIRNVFHLSGGYELPFGKGKKYLANANPIENSLIGGWSGNVISSLQGGQPVTYSCPTSTTSGTNCNDVKVAGTKPETWLPHRCERKAQLDWKPRGLPAALSAGGCHDSRVHTHESVPGRQPRYLSGTGPRQVRLLGVQVHSDQRALLDAVPGRVLQHPQSPNVQRAEFRRQRCNRDFRLGQLHQQQFRRNRFDSSCTLRSETDPVCPEAVLLS